MTIYHKPVYRLMKEDMVQAFGLVPGKIFTKQQAIEWFSQHYPLIKTGTIKAHLTRQSTNAKNRVHFHGKPIQDDVFYQIDNDHFRLYEHGNDPTPIHS